MSRKVLVTGVCGFIGYHAARALRDRGDSVIGIDNFNAYYSPKLKRARLQQLQDLGIKVVEGDICNRGLLEELFTHYSFTHVLHLAAQAGVRYARENPDAYLKANLEGFLSILETMKLF